MKNILFIHGFNGSPDGNSFKELQKCLDPTKYNLFSLDYNEYNADDAIEYATSFCKNNNIDLIVGTSLGGFIALNVQGIPRLVHNPCYSPSIELPKLVMNESSAQSYNKYEQYLNYDFDIEERLITFGLFSDNDELLGDKYLNVVNHRSKKILRIAGNHRLSENNIRDSIIPFINEIFNYLDELYNQCK